MRDICINECKHLINKYKNTIEKQQQRYGGDYNNENNIIEEVFSDNRYKEIVIDISIDDKTIVNILRSDSEIFTSNGIYKLNEFIEIKEPHFGDYEDTIFLSYIIKSKDNKVVLKICNVDQLNNTYIISKLNLSPKLIGIYKIITKKKNYYAFCTEFIDFYSNYYEKSYTKNIIGKVDIIMEKHILYSNDELFKQLIVIFEILVSCGILYDDILNNIIIDKEKKVYINDFENIHLIEDINDELIFKITPFYRQVHF